jgi:tRNA (mo5U34)-methyltransferase
MNRAHVAMANRPIRPEHITSIEELYRLSESDLMALSQKVSFYHTVDVGHGVVIHGHYDHRPVLSAYRFPDVAGKRVLDVGRASGFFSFVFERMGAAHVTAVDLPPSRAKNIVGLEAPVCEGVGRLDFFICHALLRSKVEPVWADANGISEANVGAGYDVAFVGSLLVHLADPIGCLARIRQVLKPGGVCIIANPIGRFDHLLSYVISRPTARLAPSDKRTSWWIPNIPCLIEMPRRAGFAYSELVTRSLLLRRHNHRTSVRHAVVHAAR